MQLDPQMCFKHLVSHHKWTCLLVVELQVIEFAHVLASKLVLLALSLGVVFVWVCQTLLPSSCSFEWVQKLIVQSYFFVHEASTQESISIEHFACYLFVQFVSWLVELKQKLYACVGVTAVAEESKWLHFLFELVKASLAPKLGVTFLWVVLLVNQLYSSLYLKVFEQIVVLKIPLTPI